MAEASQVRLVNQALLLLGESVIQSLDEDTSEAKIADAFYEDARDHCLRDIKPSFARRRSGDLVAVAKPEFDWDFAFQLPQGCLVVLDIPKWDVQFSSPRQDAWRVEGKTILSNRSALSVLYIARDENVDAQMDASFKKALAAYLAYEMAYPITNDNTKVSAMYSLYEQRADDARATYALEGSTIVLENTQLTRVR